MDINIWNSNGDQVQWRDMGMMYFFFFFFFYNNSSGFGAPFWDPVHPPSSLRLQSVLTSHWLPQYNDPYHHKPESVSVMKDRHPPIFTLDVQFYSAENLMEETIAEGCK